MVVTFVLGALCAFLWWADEVPLVKTDGPAPAATAPAGGAAPAALTDAERITRLQRAIDADEKALRALQAQIDSPASEFREAEANFKELDKQLAALTAKVEGLRKGGKAGEAGEAGKELDALRAKWQLAKERFNLAIQERKALQQKVVALKEKAKKDRLALATLTNAPAPTKAPPGGTPASTPAAPGGEPAGGGPAAAPVAGGPPAGPGAPAPTAPPAGQPEKPATAAGKKVQKAREEAKSREDDARQAREKAESLTDRIEAVRRALESEQRLLEGARKKAELARRELADLSAEAQRKVAGHAPEQELLPLWMKLTGAQQRADQAGALQRAGEARLNDLRAELAELRAEQAASQQEAEEKQGEADRARKKLNWLEHPLHPQNVLVWLSENGPKLVAILLGVFGLHFLVRVTTGRMVTVVTRINKRGTEDDRRNRAESLVGIFRNAARIVIFGGGALMALESVGIPIVPLLGGAAVVGLAVAFGAQNLIRDYFAGFMMLLEDQYSINDVVRINNIAGLVEGISLRVTVLRDLSGVVHFVPHGTITTVSNMTHGWSRAFFEVGVSYREDVDRVMAVMTELGKALRDDPKYGPLILDDPEMLGVDSFGDSAVNIQFFIKTLPLQQWAVKRELLRRIKHRFDELGIEIPFPHRTVFHRHDPEEVALLRRGEDRSAA